MSGGSYNYLYKKTDEGLMLAEQDIRAMADRLAGLGYARDAALETESLLLTIRQFRNRVTAIHQRLSSVWHAVEWWDSGDSGEDGVKKALDQYRGAG